MPESQFRRKLETETQTELHFAPRLRRGVGQGLARRKAGSPLHTEGRSKISAYDIVDSGIVRPVGDVKSFRCELQGGTLAQFEPPAQAHVEIHIIGTKTAVAPGSRRPVVGEMIVAIDVSTGQEIEGMTTVVRNHWRQLKAG